MNPMITSLISHLHQCTNFLSNELACSFYGWIFFSSFYPSNVHDHYKFNSPLVWSFWKLKEHPQIWEEEWQWWGAPLPGIALREKNKMNAWIHLLDTNLKPKCHGAHSLQERCNWFKERQEATHNGTSLEIPLHCAMKLYSKVSKLSIKYDLWLVDQLQIDWTDRSIEKISEFTNLRARVSTDRSSKNESKNKVVVSIG